MKLVILGVGYVGLVSGVCFAELGHDVVCIDSDNDRISALNNGRIPIYEPGLSDLVERNKRAGRISFHTDLQKAVPHADAVFIAVGTPSSRRGDGYADLTYVYNAAAQLASCISGYTVIVNKSTVPVGTAKQVGHIIRKNYDMADFDVVANPEFLREGSAIQDFMQPDRIVVGSDSERASEIMREIYAPLVEKGAFFLVTNPQSAELVKYASNSFLATKISFINEIANLCEAVGADVGDIAYGMGLDRRIGKGFLSPGPGYGGSCFPKDTRALLRIAQEHGVTSRIVESVVEVNEAQKAHMVHKICKAMGGSIAEKTIGVLGLSFKPDTDDIREAPALTIIPRLIEKGAHVKAHDPVSMQAIAEYGISGIELVESPWSAAENADCLVLMTEWKEYRSLDLQKLKDTMRNPILVDLRNMFDPEEMKSLGFTYYPLGMAQP